MWSKWSRSEVLRNRRGRQDTNISTKFSCKRLSSDVGHEKVAPEKRHSPPAPGMHPNYWQHCRGMEAYETIRCGWVLVSRKPLPIIGPSSTASKLGSCTHSSISIYSMYLGMSDLAGNVHPSYLTTSPGLNSLFALMIYLFTKDPNKYQLRGR